MNANFQNLLLALAASASVACATANDNPDDVPTPVAETGAFDTQSYLDTFVPADAADTSVADTMVSDAERCTAGAAESKPCGFCGTQNRFCLSEGTWTAFTACTGEKADAECSVGEKRTNDCGNCGKATDFCDVKTCTWTAGFCAGEGPCAEGDEETTKASCSVTGEIRTRTCNAKCEWSDFSACDLPRGWQPMAVAPITGRGYHSAVWTGTDMLIWGGGYSTTVKNDGASYNPGGNVWKMMSTTSLPARRLHHTGWTGSKMIVWGGFAGTGTFFKDGAIYDPSTDTWTAMATSPLAARHSAAHAWSTTTNEFLVWSGCTTGSDSSSNTTCNGVATDGAAYDPATNTWTALPAAPTGFAARTEASYIWSGTELIIWGGKKADGSLLTDGVRFDPATRAWTKFSDPSSTILDGRFDTTFVNDGSGGLLVWGGRSTTSSGTSSNAKSNGAIYTPGVGWSAIPAVPETLFSPTTKRYDVAGYVLKGKLWLLDGVVSSSSDLGGAGFASYELATGKWDNVDMTGAPSPGTRGHVSVVSTGRELLFFGGINGHTCCTVYNNGGVFRP